MTDEKKYPKVAAGAVILNKENKIFLMKSAPWQNKLVIPGGHIEWGEKTEDALKREVLEETGLSIKDVQLLTYCEFILDPQYKPDRHTVVLNFVCRTDDPPEAVKLDGREGCEAFWLFPEEILSRDDVVPAVKSGIKIYQEKNKKKSFFARECKNCETLKQECAEYKSGWQRALADYKNLQKETLERRGEWANMSEVQILEEFIPVYDNFKKAFSHHPELKADDEEHKQMKNWTEGIGYIMKQFWDVLKAHNIEEIKTVGEKFDARWHEAVGEEAADGKESGIIIKEIDGGYKMREKVIKAAKVIVAK